MAVNDNMIELIAKLDEDKSVDQIVKTDIPIIRDRINSSKALQIKCTIDEDSINDIKNQLKDIKINVGASIQPVAIQSNPITESEVKINATSVKEQIAELKQTLNANLSGSTKEVMEGLTSQIKEGSTVWTNWLRGANDKVKSFSISVREATGELTKYNYAINEYGNAKFLGSSGTDKGIEKVQKEIDSFVKQLSAMKRNVGSFTGIYADIGEGADRTRITFNTLEKSIEDLKNGKKSIADVRGEIVALQGAVDSVNSTLGHAQGKGFNKFENAETDARSFDNTIKKIETDLNGLNKADGNVKELSKRLKAVRTEALDLANVSEKTQEWAYSYDKVSIELKDIQSEIKIIKQLEKQDKSSAAQRTLSDLKAIEESYKAVEKYTKILKSPTASKEEKNSASAYVLNYNKRIEATKNALATERLLTKEVRARIKEIEKEHTEVMNGINAKAKGIAAQEEENKRTQKRSELLSKIESALKSINQYEQKKVGAGDNASEVYTDEIEHLTQIVELSKEELANSKLLNSEAKQRISDAERELELKRKERSATALDKSNQDALRQGDIYESLRNRIASASAAMVDYANKNRKAVSSNKLMSDGVTTFAQKWQELTERLNSEEVRNSPEAFKHLNEELKTFKKEADANNLTISGFFRNMRVQLSQVIMQWVSLQGAVRIIRSMINEVTSLDTAMINMRRVTVATDEEYSKFLDDANSKARELRTTTSSLIEQSYQWAKLGYDMKDSLELAQASTIFSKVADVDQEQSLSNLVTALKAFNKEADFTIKIVDMLDKLNNEYAVSAAGLGEGLERSASAMAMTGNSLEQTLALLTGTGEITQNLENTGQALRIISLRLQNMKGELEELGEPVDDLMEVSKVQTQILNLTKNQVNIFDQGTENFRSTYDIMKDISEVWDTLSSTDRASLTEILFGKNRANVGLAMIQAFQSGQIEAAYEDAQNAAGTATKEYERMMDGIESHFAALKGQFQELANTVIHSDFINNVVQSATTILRLLTLIADKLGTFPTLVAGIYAARNLKNGKGIFGLEEDAKKATSQLTIFGKKWTDIQSDLEKTNTSGLNKIGVALDGIRLKSIAAKAGVAALNALVLFGISSVVSWGFDKILEFVNKEKEAAKEAEELSQKQEELRKQTLDNAKIYDQESKEVQNLISQYVKLISSTDNINNVKGDLSNLQDQLISKYGDEAKGIDLVNKSLEENIRLLTERQKKENEQWLKDNQEGIDEAKRIFDINEISDASTSSHAAMPFVVSEITSGQYSEAKQEMDLYFSEITNYLKANYSDLIDNIEFSRIGDTDIDTVFAMKVKEGLKPDEIIETINAITEAYKSVLTLDDANVQFINVDSILNAMDAWQKKHNDAYDIIKQAKELTTEIDVFESFEGDTETYDKYVSLLNKVTQLNQTLNSSTSTVADKIKASDEIQDAVLALQQVAVKYPAVANIIDSSLKGINESFSQTAVTATDAEQIWVESLEGKQKGAFANIDKIKTAMQSLANGNNISFKDFWEIAELDENNVISDIKAINGEYSANIESLMNVKDSLIKQQIDSYNEQIQQIKNDNQRLYVEMANSAGEITQLEDEIAAKNIDINQTVFGNIDTDSRQVLEWTYDNLERYNEAIESWGTKAEDLVGSVSTVFGTYGEYDGVDIAFSPMLQTPDGAVLLDKTTVDKYIFGLIEKAGEGWTNESLLKLDTTGLEVDGYTIKNIIADIGETAAKTSESMHYVGETGALARAKAEYNSLNDSAKGFSGTINKMNLVVKYLNSLLGNTVDKQKALEEQTKKAQKELDAQADKLKNELKLLEDEAEARLKAQTVVIDNIIEKHETELESLEKENDALNNQLEALEAQEAELNTIIDNYKSVADTVKDVIQLQIDELEKSKQSVEDYYNEQISKLKEQNEERQDAIDLAEKLAALENAKNNKIRSYSSATGWTYQVNKDSLNQVINDLADREIEQQIKELEKQRDSATAGYDKQIEGYENYASEWEKISKSIESEENERLAQQILGAEWRTKINEQDTAILKKYNTDFRSYNSQLNTLVGIEMRNLKKSIEAKNAEVKAKQEQIDMWKKYKTEVQKAADDLKGVQEGYTRFINQVALDENSSWQDRENNLLNFKNTYKTYMDEIIAKNGELTSVTDRINGLTEALNSMGNIDLSGIDSLEAELVAMEAYADSIKSIQDRLAESSTGYGIVNSAGDAALVNANYSDVQEQIKFLEAMLKNLRGYSTGGVNSYTGLAMLHGTQNGSEVIFNASQARKLYEYVDKTPNLISAALGESWRLARGSFNSVNAGTNVNMTINKMVVEAKNPEDFSKQFRTNIEKYIQTEFTKSQVYNK